jgi:hypothetical protein
MSGISLESGRYVGDGTNEQGKNYYVIARITGRGFKVRREDMRRLLQAIDDKNSLFRRCTSLSIELASWSIVPDE